MSTTKKVPLAPGSHWLLGHLPQFRRDMLGFISYCAHQVGEMVTIRLGPRRFILVSSPDVIEQVLVTENRHFRKDDDFQLLRPSLGNGLLLSEGEFWLRQRRLIQPTFLRSRIEAYTGSMVEQTTRLVANWRDGETRDIHADMMHLTLDIIAKVLMDVDSVEQFEQVGEALDVIMTDFIRRLESFFRPPFWLPIPANFRLRRAVRGLDDIINPITHERRVSGKDRGDLLSALLRVRDEGGAGMTDKQLRDEAMTLFLAGHDTTAVTLTWAWYLLARHPGVYDALQDELKAVLGGRPPTAADVPRLVYTGRVVQEVMRLYPPAYVMGRQAVAPCELAGYRLPAGATVLMSQWVTHRDPRWWDEPERFRPDRWADGLAKRLPRFAYFPFGGGPRLCIGAEFGRLEAVLVLAALAQRVRFALVPGPPVVPAPGITLRPGGKVEAVVRVVSSRGES